MSKSIFIHLSDIHLTDDSKYENIPLLILNALKTIDSDKIQRVFILFTGDMTKEATPSQFQVFKNFITKVGQAVQSFYKCECHILLVPGNHDIVLKNRNFDLDALINSTTEEIEEKLSVEIDNMSNALETIKSFDCFNDSPLISNKSFDYDNIIYNFKLLNSAPFSCMDKKDKEHHFLGLSEPLVFKQVYGKPSINIVLVHHRPDWFIEKDASILNTTISNSVSAIFFGHEHNPKNLTVSNGKQSVFLSAGGELVAKDSPNKGSFLVEVFDEQTFFINASVFELNFEGSTFINKEKSTKQVFQFSLLRMKDDFKTKFFLSPLQNGEGNLIDFFVMPSLSNGKDNFELSSLEMVLDKASDIGTFVIKGGNRVGKTTLLKALFHTRQLTKPSVFLTLDSPTNDNATKLVKNAFEDIYGEDKELFDYFLTLPKEERFVFVDRFEILRSFEIKKRFLDELRKIFGVIVVCCVKETDITNAIKESELFDEKNVYTCYGITAKGRFELVKKVCATKGVSNDYVETISKYFEKELNGVNVFDFTDPSQGILLLENIIDQKIYLGRTTTSAFTETFRYYIDNLLVSAGNQEFLDDYKIVLARLTFCLWEQKRGILFNQNDIYDAYKYCLSKGKCTTDFDSLFQTYIQSGVIFKDENGYRFKRNSYFLYFVAEEIYRYTKSGKTEYLEMLLNEISFGLNSDIALFILFLSKDIKPIKDIAKKLDNYFVDAKPLDFSDSSKFFSADDIVLGEEDKRNKLSKRQILDKKDKKEKTKLLTASKDEIREAKQVETSEKQKSIYEIVKYVEIVSKAIAGFQSLFESDERKELFYVCYNSILRLLSKYFSFTKTQVDEFESDFTKYKERRIEELSSNYAKNKSEIESIKNLSIKNFLFGLLIECLTLYESMFSYFVSSKLTIPIIDSLDDQKFENCILKLYSYIFTRNSSKFLEELEFAKKTFNPNKITNLVQFFARIYIVENDFNSETFNKICSVSGLKKNQLLPYVSRENKIK